MTVSKINLYFKEKSKIYKRLDLKLISKVFDAIKKTYNNDGQVFLMANGGSSAIAEGFAVDLRTHPFVNDDKSITTNKRRIKVECLTESSGCLTGISNDLGFEFVFREQLKNYMRSKSKNKNDLLIAFSSSGNSANIINAINFAKKFGGIVSKIADYPLVIPGSSKFPGQTGKNDNNFHIEDLQNSVSHVLVGLLKEYVQKK